jgi:hypothetical protein
MQADQSSFYDAERWKQEGQVEKLKNYLKLKEDEMNEAKLTGNMKLYRELNSLSKQLDNEVIRNTEILPVLAKIIIDHDNLVKNNAQTPRDFQLPPASNRLFGRSRSTASSSCKLSSLPAVISSTDQSGLVSSFSINNDSMASSICNSKSKSGLSSSQNVNTILKHTMNNLIRKRTENESPQVIIKFQFKKRTWYFYLFSTLSTQGQFASRDDKWSNQR